MAITSIPIWKEAPFIRLLVPLVSGIIMQWYLEMGSLISCLVIIVCIPCLFLFTYLRSFTQFRFYWITGIFTNLLLTAFAAFLTYVSDARHRLTRNSDLIMHNNGMVVTIDEPLSEKNKSFKARAVINYFLKNDSLTHTREHIILYFQKDPGVRQIKFNAQLVFSKRLMPIRHTGNPGAFDFARYCALQGIYFQGYLQKGDYTILSAGEGKVLERFLFSSRERIIGVLRRYIPGEKEAGMAEALLIGYKEDLDERLVQSYTNTGVVHIIAISGLHVGLIYAILNVLLSPLGSKPGKRWLKAMLVITGLWLFGLLAGGSASVLRSALMFTFIVTGENIGRKNSIYNSLAGSAFLMLCYHPFWLWDAGFLLSYVAVLSIVIFMKRVYNSCYIQNKLLDPVWKMLAISISAQILTTPLSTFLFHQFPNYFLITNLVAVPLSSLILFAELVLCALFWLPVAAGATGHLVHHLIALMNRFVEHINKMPFSTWNQLQLSPAQVLIIYIAIWATAYWLFRKNLRALIIALFSLACLSVMRSVAVIKALNQCTLIVYNVPRHQAIDFVSGKYYYFIGDQQMWENTQLRSLYIEPSHMLYRVKESRAIPVNIDGNGYYFGNKRIVIIDKPLVASIDSCKATTDIVILSGNPDIYIEQVLRLMNCGQFVFDSSNPVWKVKRWESDCKKFGIPCYSVTENGAFVLNMN